MPHKWEAEQTIEPPIALELIQEQFPNLGAKSIRLIGAGWDNTAFIIDEALIFRFPRREIALPLLQAEWCALPKLAPRLSLPIPLPKWRGEPSSRFPWPFIGYPMLPGYTACYANLSEQQRAALAEPIARFLSELHATPLSLIANCPITEDNHNRIDSSHLIERIAKNFDELSLLNLLENRKQLEAAMKRLAPFRLPEMSTVVHGDFYIRHLLVDAQHRLVGVIDWGDLHLGDPAIDLAIAHSFLPLEAHQTFLNTYGTVSPQTWALAQLRAIHSSAQILLYGHHAQDPDLVREGRRALNLMASC